MPHEEKSKSDIVAATMGGMLLKGYKMLASNCDVCYSVLMQDREGQIICVACENEKPTEATMEVNVDEATGDSNNRPLDPKRARREELVSSSQELILVEIKSAADCLRTEYVVNKKVEYLKYIRECTETLKSLKEMNMN